MQEAQAKAERLLDEARAESARVLEAGRAELAVLKHDLDRLEHARRTYLAQMRATAERHLAEAAAFAQQPGFGEGV